MVSQHNFVANKGYSQPYGVSFREDGINFAIFSSQATAVALCLFSHTNHELVAEIALDPFKNRTGNVWHILIKHLPDNLYYAYRMNLPGKNVLGTFLLDPYARGLSTSNVWGEEGSPLASNYSPLGAIIIDAPFDWENDKYPNIPASDLIIYEMHVRGFTEHPSSGVNHKGTFLGIIEKIPHFLDLGINAIELMPVHEFNEMEYSQFNPMTKERLYNYWGYSTVNFFSLMNRYGSTDQAGIVIKEFKMMVKELHRHGIEVILDVVFNHTAEGNEKGPILSYKGIDNSAYYILSPEGNYQNYSGCGNTFNCNYPVGLELIQDSLRYWVTEMHVDGFRFDLTSILTRDSKGHPLVNAPLVDIISNDPILAHTKLIAEPWDAAGLYQVGSFYTHENRWGEWNGKYRDVVRKFIKGLPGLKGQFATCLCGSQDLYYDRSPTTSYNFITIHDGFTLSDLVSYNQKHNLENGENNRDGNNDNESWNGGVEGPTANAKVLAIRRRQMKNLHLALMISQGVPMLLMGDEYGHTKKGNNNTWCHDNELNWFLWDKIEENVDFFHFYKSLIHFRANHSILRRQTFLTDQDIQWHGLKPFDPRWNQPPNFLAFTLFEPVNGENLYVAFNAQELHANVEFPRPDENKHWNWVVNTSWPFPNDSLEETLHSPVKSLHYKMLPYSSLVLKQVLL